MSKEGAEVKKQIQQAAIEQMKTQQWDYEYTKDHYIYMDAVIVFNRTGRDDNNVFKLNNDALEKIVYDNDSRVLSRTQKILYDKDNPRIELTFTQVDYIGIFNSQDELDLFEETCKQCNRYKNNCSILREAKEGRVQVHIVDMKCAKFKQAKK
jgi:Holliday junction resolvase RusA-like endonuclease